MSVIRESEYNGKPVLELLRDANEKFGFTFGVKKARLIMENIDAIRAFVEKYDKVPAQVG